MMNDSGIPDGYRIRLAREDDLERLAPIERECAKLFAPWGLDVLFGSATTPMARLREGLASDQLWIATRVEDDLPVGFALVSRVDWHAHLDEIDVHPAHGKRGLGRALIETAIESARARGLTRMTLVTMRDVPFNAPWYRRAGFRDLDEAELGPGMRTIFQHELAGPVKIDERVFLGREI